MHELAKKNKYIGLLFMKISPEYFKLGKDGIHQVSEGHARDLAKFGSLFLHRGQWNGKQIIPATWVESSTRRQFRFRPRTGADSTGQFGYGHLWWYNCLPTPAGLIEARTAIGNGQQRIFVLPGLDMVVMRGITLVPRRGVEVEVTRRREARRPPVEAAAASLP